MTKSKYAPISVKKLNGVVSIQISIANYATPRQVLSSLYSPFAKKVRMRKSAWALVAYTWHLSSEPAATTISKTADGGQASALKILVVVVKPTRKRTGFARGGLVCSHLPPLFFLSLMALALLISYF